MKFQITRVKETEQDGVLAPKTDYPTLISSISENIAKIIAVYMASDTLRKIIVHTVATKIV